MVPPAKSTGTTEESDRREILSRDQQARGRDKDYPRLQEPPNFPLLQVIWLSLVRTRRCHLALNQGKGETPERLRFI